MNVYPSTLSYIPLVFQDVSEEETFGSIAASLSSLLSVSTQVFTRIEERAAHEKLRLQAINARLERCKAKAQLVSQSTRAVTMFAMPKFPAVEVAKHSSHIATLHDGISHPNPHQLSLAESELAPFGAAPVDKALMLPDDEVITRPEKRPHVVDLLARVSLRGRGQGFDGEGKESSSPNAASSAGGLGNLPEYLPSVCSTLLFKSKGRPYTQQRTLNDLIGYGGTFSMADEAAATLPVSSNRRAEDDASKKLGLAPTTLTEAGDAASVKIGQVEYGYKPKMRDLSTINLPSNLALPNVADISWQVGVSGANASIAPSVLKAAEPALPTILDLMPLPPPPPLPALPPIPNDAGTPPPLPSLPPISSSSAPPPPPPPPPPQASQPGPPRPPAPPAPPSSASSAPMPPPPPPPPSAPPQPSPDSSSGTPNRGGLLAALTNPENLKKLKKIAADEEGGGGGESAKKPEPKASPAPAAPKAMNMAEEMAARLLMRRKAMAGEKSAPSPGNAPKPPPAPNSSADAPPPPPPPPPSSAAATSAAGSSSSSAGGLFRPESMHGFTMKVASKPKKKKDDDDDWGDSDDD